MRTTIQKIGDAKGVIIPASLLSEIEMPEEVEITLKNRALVIQPLKQQLREGWYEGYQASEDEDAWEGFVAMPGEDKEWVW